MAEEGGDASPPPLLLPSLVCGFLEYDTQELKHANRARLTRVLVGGVERGGIGGVKASQSPPPCVRDLPSVAG